MFTDVGDVLQWFNYQWVHLQQYMRYPENIINNIVGARGTPMIVIYKYCLPQSGLGDKPVKFQVVCPQRHCGSKRVIADIFY